MASPPATTPPAAAARAPAPQAKDGAQPPRRSLGDLLEGQDLEDLFRPAGPGELVEFTQPTIDEERVQASGIRRVNGAHLTLYTDLPAAPAIDELPAVFDLAVPQWCAYFQIDAAVAEKWKMVGYLMNDRQRFERAGLLPADLPPFLHGFQRGAELWCYEQPTDYYRRHLLLHEGTHGFMHWGLGGAGPPWYMEGTAELLATHRWDGKRLEMNHFPASKEETPHWGRIKVIKDETARGQGKSLETVMQYDETAHLQVEPYAWCWAAAAFFDNHPAYRQAFRDLRQHARDRSFSFTNRFHETLKSQWPHLTREWQTYIINMEYGYDVAREAIDARAVVDLPDEGGTATVLADRGWQSTGYRLQAGQTYQIEASGRYQVADQPKIWWCEPNGVTIRYVRSLPLGILLAAVVDEDGEPAAGVSALASPDPIGLGRTATLDRGGTLFLRINDSPAELADNAGELTVRITRTP